MPYRLLQDYATHMGRAGSCLACVLCLQCVLVFGQSLAAAVDPAISAAIHALLAEGELDLDELIAPVAPAPVLAHSRERLAQVRADLRAGRWQLEVLATRQNGDCAVLVFAGHAGSAPAPLARGLLWLLEVDGAWRLLPDASDHARAYHQLDEDRRRRFIGLETWARGQLPQPVAVLERGAARIDGVARRPGSALELDAWIELPGTRHSELILPQLNYSRLIGAGGSMLRLRAVATAADQEARELVIDLQSGAVEIDLRGLGPYVRVRVRGAAVDVSVTGTLFVVQRVHRDADYVALIEGRLRVRAGDEEVELLAGQAIGAAVAEGLGAIERLLGRPQFGDAGGVITVPDSGLPDQGPGPEALIERVVDQGSPRPLAPPPGLPP